MTLPGFTAVASLYMTSNNPYRLASNQAVIGFGEAVIPQAGQPPDCIPGCICFSPVDCPCCSVYPFQTSLPNALRLGRIPF